jgi:hypothetical protein
MRNALLFVVLVFSLSVVALAFVIVDPAAAANPVIVGKWDRTDGVDVYTIYANGVTETVIEGQTYHGTWEYDGSGGYKYIFHWEHSPPDKSPFIDYVTVAADGQSYSGVNNYGDDFHCVRIGDAPAAESGSFPIVPVAVGGGIAAVAAGGAAAYYFLIAKHGAESAAGAAGAPGSGESFEGHTDEVAMGKVGGFAGTDSKEFLNAKGKPSSGINKLLVPDPLKSAKDLIEQLKTQQVPPQNQDKTPNSGNEQPQQETTDDSPTTQEVADSEGSSSNANA